MLSISDWVSFLSSEKNPNISNIISIGAFALAAFAVAMSAANTPWLRITTAVVLGIILMVFLWRFFRVYGGHAKVASRLLNDIMSGKESDLSKIKERWEKEALGHKGSE